MLKTLTLLLTAALLASLINVQAFAANLPVDEPVQVAALVAASATSVKVDDAAAAKALRAFIAAQRPASALMANGNGFSR